MIDPPALITFDIFGTVLDWRRGTLGALRERGVTVTHEDFDRIIDAQAAAERGRFRPYVQIIASSLIEVLGLDRANARAVADEAGHWPLFPDSRAGLRRLMTLAPCVAMSNSDLRHAKQVQRELGFQLSGWISAELVRAYKPDPAFWHRVQAMRGIAFGPRWWHVSAYADYDLDTARRLGLTCVFVDRPHARPGHATLGFRSLEELAERVGRVASCS